MTCQPKPQICQRVRHADGRTGFVRFIAVEEERKTQSHHAFMVAGDVEVMLEDDRNSSVVTHESRFWQTWEVVPDDVIVTVCAECRQATCWYGMFMCSDARGADVVKVPRQQAMHERREHWCYLTDAGIEKYTGMPPEHATMEPTNEQP